MSSHEDESNGDPQLVVLKCEDCGDTFPSGTPGAACPSCGGKNVREAHEPLL